MTKRREPPLRKAGALGVPGARASGGLLLQREPVLQAGGDGAVRRSGGLLVERYCLEWRDAELAVGADQDGGCAALLRRLALRPGGDELVTLPLDLDGLQGADRV